MDPSIVAGAATLYDYGPTPTGKMSKRGEGIAMFGSKGRDTNAHYDKREVLSHRYAPQKVDFNLPQADLQAVLKAREALLAPIALGLEVC
jgi:hypothetical protein